LVISYVFKVGSVYAVEAVETVDMTPHVQRGILNPEILKLRKSRNFNLNVILGILAAAVLIFMLRNNINTAAEDPRLVELQEGVMEISRVIDQKQQRFLEFRDRHYQDFL
jgi:hypothetical protein